MSLPFPPGLLLITDRSQALRPLPEICAAAVEAGFGAVMVREKDLDAEPLLELARPIAGLCAAHDRPFLINDRIDVAMALPDAGAHLGFQGIPVSDARRILGPRRILGYSAHGAEEGLQALGDGADYITLSPIYSSASKPGLTPKGIAFLSETAARLPAGRILALGGVQADLMSEVRRAGAAGAAVMGALMRAEDPRAAALALMSAWEGAV